MAESEGGEKTEEPTSKRLDDALKRGDVAKSQELNVWFGLAAATLVISIFGEGATASLAKTLTRFLASPETIVIDGLSLRAMAGGLGIAVGAALALPMVFLMLAAIAGNMVQHRPIVTAEPLAPKFSKISPGAGFKRIFSVEGLINFVKGLIKIGIVGAVIWNVAWPERTRLATLAEGDVANLLPLLKELTLEVLVASVAVFALIAIADYLFQRHRWRSRLKMSLQEVKDEHKQSEGDPLLKSAIRSRQLSASRGRQMTDVAHADVVLVNPTHVAVGLRYDSDRGAPRVVAKGAGVVAARLREKATEHDVAIVEDVPLARALFVACELGDEIPAELYTAVAQVLAFVVGRRSRGASGGRHRSPRHELDVPDVPRAGRRRRRVEAAA